MNFPEIGSVFPSMCIRPKHNTNKTMNLYLSVIQLKPKLEAPWAEPVSLIYHFVLRKLYTERP